MVELCGLCCVAGWWSVPEDARPVTGPQLAAQTRRNLKIIFSHDATEARTREPSSVRSMHRDHGPMNDGALSMRLRFTGRTPANPRISPSHRF